MTEEFYYVGKHISISLHWVNENLSIRLFKINPDRENGDLFFSQEFLLDNIEDFFNFLCFPYSASNVTWNRPISYSVENLSYQVFHKICAAIRYYDLQNQVLEGIQR